jgi:hypothetical protein
VEIFATNSAAEERDRKPKVSIGCLLCAQAPHCAKKQLGINPVHRPRTNRPDTDWKPMLLCGRAGREASGKEWAESWLSILPPTEEAGPLK